MCLSPGQKAKASCPSCRHNRLDRDQRHIGIAFAATGMCGATTAMRQCAVLGVDVVAEAYALTLFLGGVRWRRERPSRHQASAAMSLEEVHPGFAIAASTADRLYGSVC